ncbi:LysR substrate-binding domain-containing protein [Dickeya solani]|uniref:LysR substrate-binding domain-containing protein n=2 Tax=Dickeya solani TaxID=1089444 RepID=A0ABU4ED50_9GAMM|nr:LysR substrate-binding domain-containing protein [Dickeya solani]ANE76277.1 LysR family transcriptional regulator [Dickeya solani IPO 2222]AUC43866.1 LysR family transcriptional regulator YnfL [Dickeya solani RNS 08.23.3.1.A]AUH08313.1 LysR family transcriptional regulator [Dickeya solani D s0432-1]AUH12318.1 LysR family transcriptional regulator [Dickeya solani]AYQ46750.1 HTH-type transcriptional regulator CatM [Dickeya solani]
MEFRHLRYFVMVAEELHFTRAAARLNIGQPPLSQQIQALEAELNVQLFQRTRRSVRLTEAGEHLLVRAREILGASEEVAIELQRISQGEAGELRISFTSTGLLVKELRVPLRTFRAKYPAVRLTLKEMFTHLQFAALLAGDLDIGYVRFNELKAPEGLTLRLVRRDRLCLVLPDDHRLAGCAEVSIAEVRDEPFIGYPVKAGASLSDYVTTLCTRAGFVPNVTQEAREAMTQIGLVAAGMGVAVLLQPMDQLQPKGVCFVPLSDEGAELCMALVTRESDNSPRVRNFVELVCQE